MPELPEVETVRRGLLTALKGRTIKSARVLRKESVGHPSAKQFSELVSGKKVVDIRRRGKYLLFDFAGGGGMGAHLRMSGRLLVDAPKESIREEHVRVTFELDNGRRLVFEDMRVFGRVWYVDPSESFEQVIPALKELGPEPLDDLRAEYLLSALKLRKQAIKAVLLDQTVIAGIGNIYADECLFLGKVNPLKPAQKLSLDELTVLRDKIRLVLGKAIELGGSSLRNYTDSSGVNGEYQAESWVYGRKGEPCRDCGTAIERIKIAGRSSHHCPECQPLSGASKKSTKKPAVKSKGRREKTLALSGKSKARR